MVSENTSKGKLYLRNKPILARINKLSDLQASIIIAVVGLVTFFSGLTNPFQGDDLNQIVSNTPVHSISHIKLFFTGGTFAAAKGSTKLVGSYYRPLMTTVFSLLYTVFGPHPLYFHLFQLLLCIASACFLYSLFRYSFKAGLSLFLALIFLVHPMDSQVVFNIPNMQDALYFLFGIVAVWLLVRYDSTKVLFLVAFLLLLSLLSKETGILFVFISIAFIFWDNKKRLLPFLGIMVLPIAVWLLLKIHAVGLNAKPRSSPIDLLSLKDRLLTAPSLMQFYLTKFVFPWKLSSAYFWTYPNFSFAHFVIPLLIDLTILGVIVYAAMQIRKYAPRSQYVTFLFFSVWLILGIAINLQIIPLDMTASETWFYVPMAGLLGMIGVVLKNFGSKLHIDTNVALILVTVLILVFGVRCALRGTDGRTAEKLAYADLTASKQDYLADDLIATDLQDQGHYAKSLPYAQQSIRVYPDGLSYCTLGVDYDGLGNFTQAQQSYLKGLTYPAYTQAEQLLYENSARLMLWMGDPTNDAQFMKNGLTLFPRDSTLWLDLAILQYTHSDQTAGKQDILQAYNINPDAQIAAVLKIMLANQKLLLGPLRPL
jgi:hypothetical protein